MYPIDYEAAWGHIQFIANEAVRFAKMPAAELLKHEPKFDLMHTLPAVARREWPTIIGAEADSRVVDLCDLYLAQNENRDRYDRDVVIREMKSVLIDDVLLAGSDLDDNDLSELLQSLTATLDSQRHSLTHHIPCITVLETDPSRFEIGPVVFKLTTQFLAEKAGAITAWEKQHVEKTNAVRVQRGMEPLKARSEGGDISPYLRANSEFFSAFPWVASVGIGPCHPGVSRERAISAVQSAIDLLSVATRGERGRRMRIGYGAIEPSEKAWLSETREGTLLFSHSSGGHGVAMGDGWIDVIQSKWKWFFIIGGNLLQSVSSSSRSAPIWTRYLEGLRWYGEAIRDTHLPSQIAKYSACMERLVITGKGKSVSKKLPFRMGVLLKGMNPEYPHDELEADIARFYGLRCEIMHGDDIPDAKRLQWGAMYGDYFCANGLIRCMDLFHYLTTKERTTDVDLGEAFDKLGRSKKP